MEMIRCLYFIFCGVAVLVSSQTPKSVIMCLTSDVYENVLSCTNPQKILVHSEITYGVNTDSCTAACCVDDHILCSQPRPTAGEILSSCNGVTTCMLKSIVNIPLKAIQCDGSPSKNATFATIEYICVDEITSLSSTTVVMEATQTSTSTTTERQVTGNATPSTTTDNKSSIEGIGDKGDLPLVIGLSIAGGVIIIAIVVVIAVFSTRRQRNGSSDSHNSTKTLATSDIESGSSPSSGQSTEDVFGFAKSAENQHERLQKRNDNIKRNQSVKSEDSKNKRPSKLGKHKSKSKSSSLDQLDTKPKSTKDSQKSKQTDKTKKQAASKYAAEDKKKAGPGKAQPSGKEKGTVAIVHAVDSKSETNLLSI